MGGPTTDRDAAAAPAESTPTATGQEADAVDARPRERSGTEGNGDGAGPTPSDPEGRRVEWLPLDGDRLSIALAGSLLPLVAFALLELAGVVPLQRSGGLFYLFGGFVSGNLTLVTVVVSINQLLLTRGSYRRPGSSARRSSG